MRRLRNVSAGHAWQIIGSLRWRGLAGLAFLLVPGFAIAEVCDKAVGESWRTEDGPVWLLNPVGFPFALTTLIGGLVLVAGARLPWLGYFGAVFLAFAVGVAVFNDLIPEHDIHLAQIREGCRSHPTDLLNGALITAFALTYLLLGYRASRSKRARQVA